MTEREALKLALEWFEGVDEDPAYGVQGHQVIAAIKEALAQPEQEPVAFSCLRCVTPKKCAIHGCSPNTWPSETPPQRKPLTDEEKDRLANAWFSKDGDTDVANRKAIALIEEVEAAHDIKG